MTSSKVIGCSTGRSAGWAPLRSLSTSVAARPRRHADPMRYNADTLGLRPDLVRRVMEH